MTRHTRIGIALAALVSVTLTAGILTAAPLALANGPDDEGEVKVIDPTALTNERVKHVDCIFGVVTKDFDEQRLGSISFFAIRPSGRHQPLEGNLIGQELSGNPGPSLFARNAGTLGLPTTPPSVVKQLGDDVHILVEVKTKNGKTWHYKFWLGVVGC